MDKQKLGKKRRMNRILFNQANLLNLKIQNTRQRYYDIKIQGLLLEVMPSGTKVFRYFKKHKGKQQWNTIGNFPEVSIDYARAQAASFAANILFEGVDFAAERIIKKNESTLLTLAEQYFKDCEIRQVHTIKEMRKEFQRWFSIEAPLQLSQINRSVIKSRINELACDGHLHRANKALDLIQAIFSFGVREEFCKEDPVKNIKDFKVQSRDRRVYKNEMEPLLDAIYAYPDDRIRDFLLLCLFTGARCGKVKAMRWDELNLEMGVWRINKGKNGESQTIALTVDSLEILKARKQTPNIHGWVFPGGGKNGISTTNHITEPKKAWAKIRTQAGMPDLRIHDLRRTLGSMMVEFGASTPIIQKQLHHKSIQAAAVYQRVALDPVRVAVNTTIHGMLSGTKYSRTL